MKTKTKKIIGYSILAIIVLLILIATILFVGWTGTIVLIITIIASSVLTKIIIYLIDADD